MSHRPIVLWTTMIIASFVQLGCVQLATTDVHDQAPYQPMLGRTYELKEPFRILATRWDPRSPQPDYLLMVPDVKPNIGGREFTLIGVVPQGSRFEIAGVRDRFAFGGRETIYVARFPAITLEGQDLSAVWITGSSLFPLLEPNDAREAAPALAERYFTAVTTASP